MKIHIIPTYPYSSDPWVSERHPHKIFELYKRSLDIDADLYLIGAPGGLEVVTRSMFSPRSKPPMLMPAAIHPLSAVIEQQLREIAEGAEEGKPINSWIHLYTKNRGHEILRESASRAYAALGMKLIVKAIYNSEKEADSVIIGQSTGPEKR